MLRRPGRRTLTIAPMRLEDVRDWLVRYGDAWEARDAEGMSALFAPGALFQPEPFMDALRGKPAIRDHWRGRLERQSDVQFRAEVLGVGATYGVAHWVVGYRSADAAEDAPDDPAKQVIDGVLLAAFDRSGRCTSLRQWWHEGRSTITG